MNSYHILSFHCTTDSIQTERAAKEHFQVQIMPVPRVISASCGLAVRFVSGTREEILDFYHNLPISCDLYYITVDDEGQPHAEPLH